MVKTDHMPKRECEGGCYANAVTSDGWLSYLCKARQKREQLFEAIDWNNCTSLLE